MKRIVIIGLLLLPTVAIAQDSDLVAAARICESKRAMRVIDVQPGSFFVSGWEKCEAIFRECAKVAPNCIAKAAQDKVVTEKKQVDDMAAKLAK